MWYFIHVNKKINWQMLSYDIIFDILRSNLLAKVVVLALVSC